MLTFIYNSNYLHMVLHRHGDLKAEQNECQAIPHGKIQSNLEKEQVTVYDFNIKTF